MRQLTLKRTKKLTACAMSIRLYVTDGEVCDSVINGENCRMLGTLKNGEEKTFEITEEECSLYVIADELSKSFCVDRYRLPASAEPVTLSGHNVLRPFQGNPFIFDDNGGEEAEEFRRKSRANRPKSAVIISIVSVMVTLGVIIGFAALRGFLNREQPKVYTYGDMSITLTDKFRVDDTSDGRRRVYSTQEAVILSYEKINEEYLSLDTTAQRYAELIILVNSLDDSEVGFTEDGVVSFSHKYTSEYKGEQIVLQSDFYILKNKDCFYIIEIVGDPDTMAKREKTRLEWIKSVKFD